MPVQGRHGSERKTCRWAQSYQIKIGSLPSSSQYVSANAFAVPCPFESGEITTTRRVCVHKGGRRLRVRTYKPSTSELMLHFDRKPCQGARPCRQSRGMTNFLRRGALTCERSDPRLSAWALRALPCTSHWQLRSNSLGVSTWDILPAALCLIRRLNCQSVGRISNFPYPPPCPWNLGGGTCKPISISTAQRLGLQIRRKD